MILQYIRNAKILIFQMLLISCIIFSAAGVGRSDEERKLLNGRIEHIDTVMKQVVVDVVTLGCEGTKTFSISNLSKFNIAKGDVIKFYVDSPYCPRPEGHKIIDLWRVGR